MVIIFGELELRLNVDDDAAPLYAYVISALSSAAAIAVKEMLDTL